MDKYTAINIGPISATFTMARKPREFWQASYMFSHLMELIVTEISACKNAELISPVIPAVPSTSVGLYPDRAFFRQKAEVDVASLIDNALDALAKEINIGLDIVKDYFNVMAVTLTNTENESIISRLNQRLDYLELQNSVRTEVTENKLIEFITKKYNSPLFIKAFGTKSFEVNTLDEIAGIQLKNPSIQKKTHHNYICIVQADGDNMGSVISRISDAQVTSISKSIMEFGVGACELIKTYGGLPIYAGGDDLLFIAPVIGNNGENILSLLSLIDNQYQVVEGEVTKFNLRKDGKTLGTSMSYGVSMTYFKFPLYETWSIAQEQLFVKAKNVEGKNAIAWKLQKHSGGSFEGAFSKSDTVLYQLLTEIIQTGADEKMVSAISHKIRANEGLLSLWKNEKIPDNIKTRIDAFFDKVLDLENKDGLKTQYSEKVKELLIHLYNQMPKEAPGKEDMRINQLISTIYSMLRTAKFINGEEEKL